MQYCNNVDVINQTDSKKLLEDLYRSFSDKNYIFSDFSSDNFVMKAKIHRPEEKHLKILYDFYALNAIKAEKSSPGAGKLAIELCLKALEENKDEVDIHIDDSYFLEKNQIFDLIHSSTKNHEITDIVKTITEFAGVGTSIVCESFNIKKPLLEISSGHTFKLTSPIEFRDGWKRSNVSVLILDGFVETVSEIHHLLTKYSASRLPLVIIARNFSNDVINTIAVNNKRDTLDVILVNAPMELDSLNSLLDISVITGAEVISSEKGQLISAVQQNKIATVDSVSYDNSGMLTFVNEKNKSNIDLHVLDLTKRSENCEAQKKEMFDKRIKSLSSNSVNIKFPRELKYEYFDIKIDFALRLFSELVKMKVVDYVGKTYTTKCILIAKTFASSMLQYSKTIACAVS